MTTRPRLLIATKAFLPEIGGVEETVHDIASGCAPEFDVTVLAVSNRRRTVTEHHNGFTIRRVAKLAKVFSAPLSLGYSSAFRELAATADIINLHSPYPPAEFEILRLRHCPPLVVTYHLDIVRQRIVAPIYLPVLRRVLERASRIVVSNPNLSANSRVLQSHASKIKVVPCGLEPQDFVLTSAEQAAVQELRRAESRPKVLFVGRLVYYKGVKYLIDAVANLNVHLTVVGQGKLARRLKMQAQRLGIAGRVTFLPHLPRRELVIQFHACDVFVLPSIARSESFGLVLIEAMCCGKPVVSTELGTGTSWINQHGVTGLVVPPCDSQALAAALERLTTDPTTARLFGQAARQRVVNVFSRENFDRGYRQVFRSALAPASLPPGNQTAKAPSAPGAGLGEVALLWRSWRHGGSPWVWARLAGRDREQKLTPTGWERPSGRDREPTEEGH